MNDVDHLNQWFGSKIYPAEDSMHSFDSSFHSRSEIFLQFRSVVPSEPLRNKVHFSLRWVNALSPILASNLPILITRCMEFDETVKTSVKQIHLSLYDTLPHPRSRFNYRYIEPSKFDGIFASIRRSIHPSKMSRVCAIVRLATTSPSVHRQSKFQTNLQSE